MQAMIQGTLQAVRNQRFDEMERPLGQTAEGRTDFSDLFGDATKAATPAVDRPAPPPTLGDPDVQGWLNSYYAEMGDPSEANAPYQAAPGAANNYPAGSVYGPEQVYTQALYNQGGTAFAALTGGNPADFTSQLPGIPATAAQQAYDALLANENAQRLASGQPIDTAAYWSDPGPVSYDGVTYTSQELGYAGPGQSSGAEPIYISQAIPGTNTFAVPGYSGTVTGIEPNRYYTLQQLEQAGLQAGQPDAQFHPGSWSVNT
jgi:hypothetical protein